MAALLRHTLVFYSKTEIMKRQFLVFLLLLIVVTINVEKINGYIVLGLILKEASDLMI